MHNKLIRITTVPISLEKLLVGQLKYMSQHYEVVAVSGEKERLRKFGKENKVATFYVDLTREITPIKDLKAVFKLYKYFKKEKPLIVHTHTPKAGIVGMMAAYFARVPLRLHTVAGLPLLEAIGIKRRVLDIVEKITYKYATQIYPNSIGLKNIILDNKFVNVAKVKVIGAGSSNGININYFNPNQFSKDVNSKLKKELNIEENDFVFIFVGRLVGDKGINELVAAFRKLQNSSPFNHHFSLLLVGPLESDLDPLKKKTLKEIENNSDIVSLGFQQDVRPYFAISNVLVFPSYREGFPNVVMQAGAMGLPCIVSNINGCNEIIKEEENGLIISVKNSEAIYKAMKRLIEDPELKNKLQNNARNMITELYEQKIVWEALLKEYKSLENNVKIFKL
jgi:glycosyltransferase involved in cell wall biosynthesis